MKIYIPSESLDNHIAFLGGTGSGKTSATKSNIVEPALADGKRVIILDPTGVWWGLRLKANGKTGFPIYIFGGEHGDYPLNPHHGELLAETFAHSSDSVIFDMKGMTVSERTLFFTKFAETILRKNKGVVYLIIDEAHNFMPQAGARAGGMAPSMLHAGNNLVSMGRSSGFRIVLLSQRPSKLHKDSLSQVQTMVAMRLMSPQDRKAIKEWVDDQADPTRGNEIIASLPTLKPGQGWVWAPLSEVLERVQFPMPTTFDSSKAPSMEEADTHKLAPINLDKLKSQLGAVAQEVEANDPTKLKQEIARLKDQIGQPVVPSLTDEMKQAIHDEAFEKGWISGATGTKKAAFDAIEHAINMLKTQPVWELSPKGKGDTIYFRAQDMSTLDPIPQEVRAKCQGKIWDKKDLPSDVPGLSKAQRLVLTALAQYHPSGRTKHQTALLTGYAADGGGFNNALGASNTAGYLKREGDRLIITNDGLTVLGPFERLPTGPALFHSWMAKCSKCEAQIMMVLHNFRRPMTKQEIAERTESMYAVDGGGFNNALGRLRSLELIKGYESIVLSPDLF